MDILEKFVKYDIAFTISFDLKNNPSFKAMADGYIAFGETMEKCLEQLFDLVMH